MADQFVRAGSIARYRIALMAAVSSTLLLSACAGGPGPDILSGSAAPAANPQDAAKESGKAYAANRKDLDAALTHARNLKALGMKPEALAVLQQAATYHAADRRLASEYGRLALDLDQVAVAKRLLEFADDPTSPDWRIISARGAVMAKSGEYKEAIVFLDKARALAPAEPSILNNLALAHALNGDAAKGEEVLQAAAADPKSGAKVRQNYALLLGLQGRYEDAKDMASKDLPGEAAAANDEYLRRMVKHEPVARQPVIANWEPAVEQAPVQQELPPAAPASGAWSADVLTTGSLAE